MEKKKYETRKEYLIRQMFYSLFHPKTVQETKRYEMYSLLFLNILRYKCVYPEKQQDFIKKVIEREKWNLIDTIKKKNHL